MDTPHRIFGTAPHAARYMASALQRRPRWRTTDDIPDIRCTWRGYAIDQARHESFRRITGLPANGATGPAALLFPQVTGFRLLMALLTDPAWPLPIWGALQVRNRLRMKRPLAVGEVFDLHAQVEGWRVIEKGLEIDISLQLHDKTACAWESVTTFYYRGRFGEPTRRGTDRGAPLLSPPVDAQFAQIARWQTSGDAHWQFGALTGDYNGIHQWDWYARRLGFPGAFAHPQRIAAQCMARLGNPTENAGQPPELDLWIRGPVFYRQNVTLRHRAFPLSREEHFALSIDGDARAALIGSIRHTQGK